MKLLIVDDHARVREMLRTLASSWTGEVRECGSGEDALIAISEFKPDCVAMDLRMPGMGGLEATRRIVAALPSAEVAVVSAYDEPALRRAAQECGATVFIVKDNLSGFEAWLARRSQRLDWPELQQTRDRFQRLVENSADLIVESTREGLIEYVSPNVTRILGYNPEELVGQDVFRRVHPDDRAAMRHLFALPEGQGVCRYQHRDGTWRWIETAGREFASGAAGLRSVLVVRDVTERRLAEEERRRLETELRQLSRLSDLGLLAGGVAHDFNNLLAPMCLYVDQARLDCRDPAVLESLTGIDTALQRARSLVKRMQNFRSHHVSSRQPVKVATILREAVGLLRPGWPGTIRVETDVAAPDATVLASSAELHQVFANLCANAVHAMGNRGGRLQVKVAEVQVASGTSDLAPGSYVHLTVSDSGVGMSDDVKARIFEPFFTTRSATGGTGLGLAVVQRVVRDLGGAIRVTSEPGLGTCFEIHLPSASTL